MEGRADPHVIRTCNTLAHNAATRTAAGTASITIRAAGRGGGDDLLFVAFKARNRARSVPVSPSSAWRHVWPMAAAAARLRLAPTSVSTHAAATAPLRLRQLRRHIASSPAAATTDERGRSDHMALTSEQQRGSTLAWATIRTLRQLSPTVIGLELLVDERHQLDNSPPFSFVAGQWVDFHIPEVDTIGGYSITSLPDDLPVLELAVKASAHPPAAWVTRQAKVGDRVQMRVGGEFVYLLHSSIPLRTNQFSTESSVLF